MNGMLNIRQFKAFEVASEAGDIEVRGELADTEKACPECGREALKIHQYYRKRVRHLAVFNQPTYLCFTQHLMRCECGKLFLERLDFLDLNRHYTQAYEAHIYELCRGQSLERVSELEGLSWDQVEGIFKKSRPSQGEAIAGSGRGEEPIAVFG